MPFLFWGALFNPEFGIDLTQIDLFDCSDVLQESSLHDAHINLREQVSISTIIKKGKTN